MMIRLEEIADLNPRNSETIAADQIVSFVPMAALSAEDARITGATERPYFEVSKGYTPLKDGDVLVAKITPCFENGKIAQASIEHEYGFGSTEFHVIRPKAGKSSARFLHHFLRQPHIRADGEKRMTGSGGQRRVPVNYLAQLQLQLPSLEEQRRIAAILDQADALRAKRREALAELDGLAQAIFVEMFGDEATNIRQLTKKPLGDLITVKSGNFLPASAMDTNGSIPVFGGNGINGFHNASMFDLPKIVIGRVGAYCGCVHTTPNKSWVTDNAMFVSSIHKALEFDYLAFALRRANLNRLASQSGQPLISASRIYPADILVPPIESQRLFSIRQQALESLKATHRTALTELDALFASLQHRAFRGEL